MTKEELEEYFILEEECDSEIIRTAIINSNEMFTVNEVTIAIKGNCIYSTLHKKNTYVEYENISSANAVFHILKEKLKQA